MGGEGRMADFQVTQVPDDMRGEIAPKFSGDDEQFQIIFLTPAAFGGAWTDSQRITRMTDAENTQVWRTRLFGRKDDESSGIAIRVVCGCNLPYQYEGGWSFADGGNRATHALLPAGAVWYCKLERDTDRLNELANRMNQGQLGAERDLGRGEIVLGRWD
jgi:hypothetical protein